MKENRNGYYLYSTAAILGFLALFAYVFYLGHDLLVKLSMDEFTNSTVLQSMIALIITVFLGGYFSKAVEHKKQIKLEKFISQKAISLRIIDLASLVLNGHDIENIKQQLKTESIKVKLLFDDNLLKKLNEFIEKPDEGSYNYLMEDLKRFFK